MRYDRFALIGLPPTANNIYTNRRGGQGRIKTREYLEWRVAAAKTLAEFFQPFRPKTPIQLEAYLCITRQRDVDNCMKPLIDAVKEAGIIRDDRWVDRHEGWRADEVPEGMCLVFLDVFNPLELAVRMTKFREARGDG